MVWVEYRVKGVSFIRKHRINTTISLKHREMLDMQLEKYDTQRNVLENALESLERGEDVKEFSEEEEVWLRMHNEINTILTLLPWGLGKLLLETADMDDFRHYIGNMKHVESILEYNFRKPLKEFTIPELIHGVILNIKMQNSTDTLKVEEYHDHHMIYLTHRLGINCSKCLVIMNGSVFDTAGVSYETKISERSVFFKIYKENPDD